jgi:hypothetical protein
VVRGGAAQPNNLLQGAGEHFAVPGLYGFSVQYAPGRPWPALAVAGGFQNSLVSVSTVERIQTAARNLGYTVSVVRSPGSGYHATVVVPDPFPPDLAVALSDAFTRYPNPLKAMI